MADLTLRADNLVLYKQRAARVVTGGDKKIDIQTEDGQNLSVRPKDVTLLHTGPLRNFHELKPVNGEIMAAWELLAGETTTLAELVELAYGDDTPAATWAAWQLVSDGLYFSGTPDTVLVHDADTVADIRHSREAKIAAEQAWEAFLDRLRAGQHAPEDGPLLGDVVALALEQRENSRVMRALDREETPQNAHALLLEIGYWSETVNPYPQRLGITLTQPDLTLPDLAEEERTDLTHLVALAIDDEGSTDPDDALSWEDGRIWIHIADVAALVAPDSLADREARARGANLYLPEGTIHMLPHDATAMLGLGLQERSPALSFGLQLNKEGAIIDTTITPSWIKVTRLTYEEAEQRLEEPIIADLYRLAQRYAARRAEKKAIELALPEVKIRVHQDEVIIKPLPALRSRDLVREAMLMTGEAVTQYAQAHNLAIPYSTQDADSEIYTITETTLSAMFAKRRMMKPSQYKSEPGRHTGLGMEQYAQATSPLRRYTDLLVHQQLRAHLRGEAVMDGQMLMERMAEASLSMRAVRTAERLSNKHWTLVYLRRHRDWQGEGIVVEKSGNRSLV
ncbi:MAG: RNB domain-containing ribonuclease, partial [Caldilineaceae bacterium]|nr:RNB domain-containing ribonuclease [Caldilineaceae bacterium]